MPMQVLWAASVSVTMALSIASGVFSLRMTTKMRHVLCGRPFGFGGSYTGSALHGSLCVGVDCVDWIEALCCFEQKILSVVAGKE